MLKILRNNFKSFFRRLLGTEQIQQQLQHQQQQSLLSLGNALMYSLTDQQKIKATITYKRCAEIVALLSPLDVEGGKYVRIGNNYDGGYVMLDDFQRKIEAAYSLGIGSDVSWDESIACRGIEVFMYDHTIGRLPRNHPKFHYFKTGVTGSNKGVNLKTLATLIAENNHITCKNLILKMDIEGCEWDVFQEISSSTINQFYQIVVEFHYLTQGVYESNHKIVEVLKKINQTHQSIHVHANANVASYPLWIGELILPSVLEVTYIRRVDFRDKLIKNTRLFPTEHDQPTLACWPDVYLGSFSVR